MNYAIRITLPYEDCRDIISRWADRCTAAIAAQHDADEEISQTHVHIALYGCPVKPEALRRMWSDAPGSGNEFWSMKDYYKDKDDKKRLVDEGAIVYMLKGNLQPVFVKNISQEKVENSRQAWVEPVKADKPGDASEYYINLVMRKYDKYMTLQSFTEAIAVIEGSCPWNVEKLLDDVRSTTMRVFYAETRRVPPAIMYKTVAGSVFLRICERWRCFDSGIKALKDLWY